VRVAFRAAAVPAAGRELPSVEDEQSELAELEAATARAADALHAQQEEGGRSVQTVLVIEDNADLCWHLAQVLQDQFHCEFAHDGEAGVEQAFESIPDLVICDVMLPGLNGFEVTRRIKEDERTSHVPVILLTARGDEESRITGLKALADEYLTKPFSEAELRQRVDTLISIREILRQRFARDSQRLDAAELPEELGPRDRRFLERVEKALAAHHADPEFAMAEFASLVAMSERQLQRKLKALTNQAPREYLRSYRLKQSLELLRAGEPAGSVAFSVGFSSQSYFTSCFRAEYGITPGQYAGRNSGAVIMSGVQGDE
jgi:CheY-like chemotaxis protein